MKFKRRITREEIEAEVAAVVDTDNYDRWWGLYLSSFGCNAEEAFRKDPEGLLRHVKGYSNPSYS